MPLLHRLLWNTSYAADDKEKYLSFTAFAPGPSSIVPQHRGHLQLQTRVVQTADSAVWQSRRGVEIAICRLAHCHHFRTTHVHVCFDILASISYIS